MLKVRPAEVPDASKIVEILRSEFPPTLLQYTIFGCRGIERFVEDSIGHQNVGDSRWYVLCREDSASPIGFTEIRRAVDRLFINHGYVVPSARGPAVGPSLILHGLTEARNFGQTRVDLDVFHDNYTVRRGHRALGFKELHEQVWLEVAPAASACADGRPWHTSGLGLADRTHEHYGFSEFSLHTSSGSFRIGRLGSHLFRTTDAAVLSDPCALHALKTLDARRNLLCIDKAEAVPSTLPEDAIELTRNLRMTAQFDQVVQRLSQFQTF